MTKHTVTTCIPFRLYKEFIATDPDKKKKLYGDIAIENSHPGEFSYPESARIRYLRSCYYGSVLDENKYINFKRSIYEISEKIKSINLRYIYIDYGVFMLIVDVDFSFIDIYSFHSYQENIASLLMGAADELAREMKGDFAKGLDSFVKTYAIDPLPEIKICRIGSYIDYLSVFVEDEEFKQNVDLWEGYLQKFDTNLFSSSYLNDYSSSYLFSTYSRTVIISNNNESLKVIFDYIIHMNMIWNLMREVRDKMREHYWKVGSPGNNVNVSKISESLQDMVRISNLYLFEAEAEAICEWSHEYNLYETLWSSWNGDEIVRSTKDISNVFGNAIDVYSSRVRNRSEKNLQIILMSITMLTVISTGAQLVEYYYGVNNPDSIFRFYSLVFLGSVSFFLLLLAFRRWR